MSRPKPIVIAASNIQFEDWCLDNGYTTRGATFVNRPDQMRGLQTHWTVWVGIPVHWTDQQVAEAVDNARYATRLETATIDGPKWDEAEDTARHWAARQRQS